MIDMKARWDQPLSYPVGIPVRSFIFRDVGMEGPVAREVLGARPLPTLFWAALFNLLPESFFHRFARALRGAAVTALKTIVTHAQPVGIVSPSAFRDCAGRLPSTIPKPFGITPSAQAANGSGRSTGAGTQHATPPFRQDSTDIPVSGLSHVVLEAESIAVTAGFALVDGAVADWFRHSPMVTQTKEQTKWL